MIKTWSKLHGTTNYIPYKKIMVSISGGSDSDIMLDMIERVGYPNANVRYIFFDTGIEFQATKDHLNYLENKYGIKIEPYTAAIPVPKGCKRYGVPFLNKRVSQYISRLQKHGFKWEDKPFEDLYREYPKCKAALRWWCNEWGEASRFGISWNKYLKEFMVANPPHFKISDKCCDGAKKQTAHMVEKELRPDLSCVGVRKSEGGARATAYKSCFSESVKGCDQFRPIFWFNNNDKKIYEQCYEIKHSDCYTKYGLHRTGCACCPFGKEYKAELEVAKKYEPKLYKVAVAIFGDSYEYTNAYRHFCKKMEERGKQ